MRIRLRSLLSVVAVATALLSSSTPAGAATTQCAPITIDGVDAACVTVDVTQTQTPSGLTTTVTVEVSVDGQSLPPVVVPVTVPIPAIAPCVFVGGAGDSFFYVSLGIEVNGVCTGATVSLNNDIPGVVMQQIDVPYRVPQICVTVTDNCVGPVSGTVAVPVPSGISGSEVVCVYEDSGPPGTLTPLACVPLLP